MSRGPDAAALLERALLRGARQAGLDATISAWEWTGWASATFNGARHRLTLTLPLSAGLDVWLAALPDYDAAIAGKGDSAAYRNSACWARATLGQDLDHALRNCNEALRLRPGNPGYLDSRALVHLRAGRYAAAEADYAAALDGADGRFPHAQYGRGLARLKQGKASGEADLAVARAADPELDARFAGFGVSP